ncbi:MAG: DNA polymerase III subunit delta' [Deltaproteobacteria bacterium]|nr:DNA polymerase III subunit delta' [Deltaproteobacteria bacterium]MBI2209132.1 DNA polymerase III subunit delta' [Deltaproteobacteria bacterium]
MAEGLGLFAIDYSPFAFLDMPFSDIVGHRKQLESLARGLENDRLHHAYLFLGPEGIGKRTVALSLAMAIQCREKDSDFCGRCDGCVRVQNGNHPDVRVVEPLPEKKEITIRQVRELERELNYRAFTGGKKIAVVDPASLMNYAAQNALLKTLEEPPKDSLLILVSTSVGGLLATLVSRCLRLSFAPLPVQEVASFLETRKGWSRDKAELLAAMSMGSLGRAAAPEMEEMIQRRAAWAERMSSLTPADSAGWMALAEEIAGEREESLKFLDWAEGWYRDILICLVTGSSRGLSNPDLEQSIRRQADRNSRERVLFLLSRIGATAASIRRNVNRRMALEDFLMRAAGLG